MTTQPTRKGVLLARGHTDLSFELNHLQPKTSRRMRQAPYATVPVCIKRGQALNVAELLNCSVEEACAVIDRTPYIKHLVNVGKLKVL